MTTTVTKVTDSYVRIALEGALDITGSEAIEASFLNQVKMAEKSVIVDLAEVTYMASFGMRLLVQAYKSLDAGGWKLILLSPQADVAKVLEAAGLSDLLVIAADEDAAAAALR